MIRIGLLNILVGVMLMVTGLRLWLQMGDIVLPTLDLALGLYVLWNSFDKIDPPHDGEVIRV